MSNFIFSIVYKIAYIILLPLFWFKVYNKQNIPNQACILCANHTSMMDAVFLIFASNSPKGNYTIIGKAELFKNPILAAFFRYGKVVPINRKAENGDLAAIKHALGALRNGKKLLLFPEGTRRKEGEHLQAKNGVGMFALRSKCPIVPVHITPGKKLFRFTKVIIGEAFMPKPRGDKPDAEDYRLVSDDAMRRVFELDPEQKQLQA